MGLIRHNAIVVTGCSMDHATVARNEAVRIFGENAVTPTLPEAINGYATFLVGPDGSNEGWDSSDAGDARRAEFVAWLRRTESLLDWCEVRYALDDGGAYIVEAE